MFGKEVSLDTREKLRKANTGQIRSEETKLKMSEALKGKTRTEETKALMRKPKSESAKNNMSILKKGIPWSIDRRNASLLKKSKNVNL